jgi:hypothetical protein
MAALEKKRGNLGRPRKAHSPIDIAARVQAPLNMGIRSHREGKVAPFDARSGRIVL